MKILFKTLFGSFLYGTNNENSDKDYKAVYMASLEDIILKKDKETIQENTKEGNQFGVRNSKEDIDCEYIELRKFIKDALAGQTYALDMLFTPKNFWIEASDEWEDIIRSRDKILTKNVAPFIGYCRSQAGKYGLKGSRLAELTRVIDYLKQFKPKTKLEECIEGLTLSEFVQKYKMTMKKGAVEIEEEFLDVLGKKFNMHMFVHLILNSLERLKTIYGDRASQAMDNNGVDWKAVSHAYRCCYELLDLAENKTITFPLKQRDRLKEIKTGKIPYSELGDELYSLMEHAKRAIEKSSLPETPDKLFWENFILKTYL